MATKKDVTVYIGRFNPFHNGHAHVLRDALETSKLVIILLGSAGLARSLKNPFTFDERRDMIQRWIGTQNIGDTTVIIAPLRDYPYNNSLWIRNVQETVKDLVTMHCRRQPEPTILTDIHLTGSDRDSSTWYLKAFPQWKLSLVNEHRYDGTGELSATEVREILFNGSTQGLIRAEDCMRLMKMMPVTTYDFLIDFARSPEHTRLVSWYQQNSAYKKAWSVAPYAPIFTTVDAVIVQSGHLLVVERGAEPGRGLWALPGGFLNTNERLKTAVIRETLEETGLRLANSKDDAKAKAITEDILRNCIRDSEVFDAPDRSMRGRTITHAFYIRLDDTKPLPSVKGQNMPLHESGGKAIVETAKAFWLPIEVALSQTSMWFEDHHAIIETMIGGRDL